MEKDSSVTHFFPLERMRIWVARFDYSIFSVPLPPVNSGSGGARLGFASPSETDMESQSALRAHYAEHGNRVKVKDVTRRRGKRRIN